MPHPARRPLVVVLLLLSLLLCALNVCAQQVCSLKNVGMMSTHRDASSASNVCEVRQQDQCAFSCACTGFSADAVPQLAASCTSTTSTRDPLFWWAFVSLNASAFNVAYNFTLPLKDVVDETNTTFALARAFPGGLLSASDYTVEYTPIPGINITSEAVVMEGGFMACAPLNFSAAAPFVSPRNATNVSVTWTVPPGPCARLSYDLLVDGEVALTNVSGCASSVSLWLMRKCEAYEIVAQSYFLFPNNTRGPACTAASTTVSLYVNNPPLPPSALYINVLDTMVVDVVWDPSLDPGGCAQYNYTLEFLDVVRSVVIFSNSYSFLDNRDQVAATLQPSTSYLALMYTSSAAGVSANITRPFSAAAQQVCKAYGQLRTSQVLLSSFPGSPYCDLWGECTGYNAGFSPQFSMSCTCGGFYASFWLWNLSIPETSGATVNVTISVNGVLTTTNITSTSIYSFTALPENTNAPNVHYDVSYGAAGGLQPPNFVTFSAVFVPCAVYDWKAQLSPPLSPTQPNVVSLSWSTPQSGQQCRHLRFAIYSNDNPLAPTLLTVANGCNTMTVVNLLRRCQPYNLSFVTSYVRSDESPAGPPCLQTPALPDEFYVRDVPTAPAYATVEILGGGGVAVSWAPPADLGGCNSFNYSLYLIDMYNEDPVYYAELNSTTTSYTIPIALRANANYEVQLSAFTEAGESAASIYPLTTVIPQPSAGLSPGAIAGIVVGSLAGVVLLLFGAWYVHRWQRYGGYHNM